MSSIFTEVFQDTQATEQEGGLQYFPVLFGFMLAALVLLVASHFLFGARQPWLSMLLAGIPLVAYHLLYLWPKASEGLDQSAIDSVYYFGFLVTVAALGMSALAIATAGKEVRLETVIYQFGVGLFATGYAVIARLHLASIGIKSSQGRLDQLMNRYVVKSRELVEQVDLSVHSFKGLRERCDLAAREVERLVESAIERNKGLAQSTHAELVSSLSLVSKQFGDELRSTLGVAKDELAQLRGIVSDAGFASEREQLSKSLSATSKQFTALNARIEKLHEQTAAASLQVGEFAEAGKQASVALVALQTDVQKLERSSGGIDSIAGAFESAAASMGRGAGSISAVADSLNTGASKLEEATKVLHAVPDATAIAARASSALLDAVEKASSALEGLSAIGVKLGQQAREIPLNLSPSPGVVPPAQAGVIGAPTEELASQLTAGLQRVADQIAVILKGLETAANEVGSSVQKSAVALEKNAVSSAEAINLLTDNLVNLSRTIVEKTRERRETA